MNEILPDVDGDGYKLTNRYRMVLRAGSRKQEFMFDTLITNKHQDGLHRVHGGGVGWSRKYFVSFTTKSLPERDAVFAAWRATRPNLVDL